MILFTLAAREFAEWVESRPPAIRDLILRFPPNKLYRLKSSGHRVTIASYEEYDDGTVGFLVDVSGEYNAVAFERSVFGIPADGLEECALPAPDEPVGSLEQVGLVPLVVDMDAITSALLRRDTARVR